MSDLFKYEYDPRYGTLRISEEYLEDVFKLNVTSKEEAQELINALTYYYFPDKYLNEVHGVG